MFSITAKIKTWFEYRLPIIPVLHWGLDEEIPGGSRYMYCFGILNLVMFLLLAVTGILQMFFYVPTTDHAYESVMYLRLQVPFGWLIHGLHFWCAQAFVVLVGLHMARVFIWGAYKDPRQITWIIGVFLLLLVAAMTFTGPLLAWDQLGYWAAEVGTSIAGTLPWIGSFIQRFLRGGDTMGQETLSRFFVLHVAILPVIVVVFIIIHLITFRQFGSVGPWHEKERSRKENFWPVQFYKDMVIITLFIVLLVGLTVFWQAPVTGLADPIGRSYSPKPVWNFLFLYQALKVFKGPWELLGTTGIPLVLVLILLFLPFYDRHSLRDPLRRPVAMICGTSLVAFIVVLTVLGYISNPDKSAAQSGNSINLSGTSNANKNSSEPNSAERSGDANAVSSNVTISSAKENGKHVYERYGCGACHSINGIGGKLGTDLSDEGDKGRSADWLIAQIRDPKSHNPKPVMPPFPSLSQEEIKLLVDYLLSLHSYSEKPVNRYINNSSGEHLPAPGKQGPPGEAAILIGNSDLGKILFANYCVSCHGPMGKDNVPNPGSTDGMVPPLNPIDSNLSNTEPSIFAVNIDKLIQHGSFPDGQRPAIYMPAFGEDKSLTQPQIAAVESYILQLNGIDRAKIINPGIKPTYFFLLTFISISVSFIAVFAFSHLQKLRAHSKS